MKKRWVMIGIAAISLLAMSLSGVLGVKAESVNFQVKVVKADFSGLAGVPVEVYDEGTLVTSAFTDPAGDVFFTLLPKTYKFEAGNASTTVPVVSVPAAALVGVLLMPTNHYLTVQDNIGNKIPDCAKSGWYDGCTPVTLTAPSPYIDLATGAVYLFGYWDVDGITQGAGVNSITVHMDASHTATAHYTKLITFNKELVEQSKDPIPVFTKVDFRMVITVHAFEAVSGVTVKDGIGADLVLTSSIPNDSSVTVTTPGKGKMGATLVTWTIGTPVVCTDYTLTLNVSTGLNPKGKQEYTSPGEKKLNSGPVVYFTYDGTLYTLQGPPVKVTAVAP